MSRVSARPRAILALAGSLWSLITFPLVGPGWSWPWVDAIAAAEPYRSIAQSVEDPYVLFGALGALSFVAIGLALLPTARTGRWGAIALAGLIILGGPASALSYLGTPEDSPLHFMWGAEGYVLLLIGIAGLAAAITARTRWPAWAVALVGCTVLVLIAGGLALAYYPHGCLVLLGVEVAILVLGVPAPVAEDQEGAAAG